MNPFLNQDLQYEDAPSCDGLGGKTMDEHAIKYLLYKYLECAQNMHKWDQERDLHRPDRRIPMKVLVCKTFKFMDALRNMYISWNAVDVRWE